MTMLGFTSFAQNDTRESAPKNLAEKHRNTASRSRPSVKFPYKNKKSLLQREIPPAKETLFRTKTRGTTLLTRELLYQTFLLLSTKRTEVFIRQCRECSPHFLSINTKTTNPNPTSLSYLTKNLSAKPRFHRRARVTVCEAYCTPAV